MRVAGALGKINNDKYSPITMLNNSSYTQGFRKKQQRKKKQQPKQPWGSWSLYTVKRIFETGLFMHTLCLGKV